MMGIFRSQIYKYLLTALLVILLLVVGLVAYINSFSSNSIIQPASKSTVRSDLAGATEVKATSTFATVVAPTKSVPSTNVLATVVIISSTPATSVVSQSVISTLTAPTTPVKTPLPVATPTPKIQAITTTSNSNPAPTQPPPVLTFQPANRKLTTEERTALTRVERDLTSLNTSLVRLDEIRTDTHPDEPDWRAKLAKEISLWQDLLDYYKSTPMPGRVGSQIMPIWLAALARLDRAGQTMPSAYQKADGKGVSQADQEVAYAEIEMNQLGKLIGNLKQL